MWKGYIIHTFILRNERKSVRKKMLYVVQKLNPIESGPVALFFSQLLVWQNTSLNFVKGWLFLFSVRLILVVAMHSDYNVVRLMQVSFKKLRGRAKLSQQRH
jgi:hypothetical protein